MTRTGLLMGASLLQSCGGLDMPTSGLFSRNLKKTFPIAARGEGCWIIDESGRRYLDAAGQATGGRIRHGVAGNRPTMAGPSPPPSLSATPPFYKQPAAQPSVQPVAPA